MTDTLGDALPRKMKEIRDIYIPAYESIGPSARFAIAMMKRDLDRAAKALAEGDVVEMLAVYRDLEEYQL